MDLSQLTPEQKQAVMMRAQQEANQQIMQAMVKSMMRSCFEKCAGTSVRMLQLIIYFFDRTKVLYINMSKLNAFACYVGRSTRLKRTELFGDVSGSLF